jgi:nucleotide-binding universal stress UspA family protein
MVPPKRILAAVDFSETSRVALGFAARLARHSQAELHVLHVEDPLLCAAARTEGIELSRQAREELNTLVAKLALPPGIVTHIHALGGPAVEVICNIAFRENADLIAIGAKGMSGAERLVFGSTAEGVLRQSTVPVLLTPSTWSPPSPAAEDLFGVGPIVAGVDFTIGSYQATAAAFRLARLLHTPLELLHVVPALPVIDRWKAHAEAAVAERVSHARNELERLARGLALGVTVETRVETGPVAESIAHVARTDGMRHPILVLGRRLPTAHGDAPGVTAYRVVSLAQVPTLMFMERERWD